MRSVIFAPAYLSAKIQPGCCFYSRWGVLQLKRQYREALIQAAEESRCPYISLCGWSWWSNLCSACRWERAMGLQRASPYRWPRLDLHVHAHTYTHNPYDWLRTLTAILEEASMPWQMDTHTHTHTSSSFHDLKTFTFMHPHKLWGWKPKTGTVMHAGHIHTHTRSFVCVLHHTFFPFCHWEEICRHKSGCVFHICVFLSLCTSDIVHLLV